MRQLGSGQSSQPPPYDPNTVEKFCQDNGGPTIFTEIVKMWRQREQIVPAQQNKKQMPAMKL